MIATIAVPSTPGAVYRRFVAALPSEGFRGEIETSHGARVVVGTDNSIYQRLPQAVIFPRDTKDVEIAARVAGMAAFRQVVLTPRGGGTGTNGQSLTDGVVVDLSRHMNAVLEINSQEGWARVQAGVVKDQLNAAVKTFGLFFAPELSTSNRATIGGMINTDASGQGSCRYGKTRDHVLDLEFILLGGEQLHIGAVDESTLAAAVAQPGRSGDVYRCAQNVFDDNQEMIARSFPPLNRCLTGYDLAHLRDGKGNFNLGSIVCGSEGSLGFVTEARVRLLPIPGYVSLVNIRYASFMEALRDAQALMRMSPLSIETVDSSVLAMARADIVWQGIAHYFPEEATGCPAQGINLVEISGHDKDVVDQEVAAFVRHLHEDGSTRRLGHTVAHGRDQIERVYAMRKRAVGLLGNTPGAQRPQPFVEDTAVPPALLADYIAEFRDLLDRHGLRYGMFGHVDAGVLHVRPALDMRDPTQAALVRPISDAVAVLTKKYGGLLWGEHGKGVRSEYAPSFFGPAYPLLQEIKAAFDPYNQLNPGKIATPKGSGAALLTVDGVPLRGEADRQIAPDVWDSFGAAMHCNGNGACFNHDLDDAMCPSWKATRRREQSPKGRASLFREWLRLQQVAGVDIAQGSSRTFGLRMVARLLHRRRDSREDFSHEVYEAMAGCLACKSCATQCPVKVDVPQFRARFLQLYHRRYARPLRDYLVGALEFVLPLAAKMPTAYNRVVSSALGRKGLSRWGGLVDSPLLERVDFEALKRRYSITEATPQKISALSQAQRQRTVVFVQDAFTRYFDTTMLESAFRLASLLGWRIYLAPFRANGKPLQVHGFLGAFERAARRNVAGLRPLAQLGIRLVGIDPAMTLVYRQEYLKVVGLGESPQVALLQEWLGELLSSDEVQCRLPAAPVARFRLLAHCTEKTTAPGSAEQWVSVFALLGLELKQVASGCCGMSGTFGHETRNVETSKLIFEQSWRAPVAATEGGELLVTGYSCRSQTWRFASLRTRHPVEVLAERLESMVATQDFLYAD